MAPVPSSVCGIRPTDSTQDNDSGNRAPTEAETPAQLYPSTLPELNPDDWHWLPASFDPTVWYTEKTWPELPTEFFNDWIENARTLCTLGIQANG